MNAEFESLRSEASGSLTQENSNQKISSKSIEDGLLKRGKPPTPLAKKIDLYVWPVSQVLF